MALALTVAAIAAVVVWWAETEVARLKQRALALELALRAVSRVTRFNDPADAVNEALDIAQRALAEGN